MTLSPSMQRDQPLVDRTKETAAATSGTAQKNEREMLKLLDLPVDVLKEIIKQVSV